MKYENQYYNILEYVFRPSKRDIILKGRVGVREGLRGGAGGEGRRAGENPQNSHNGNIPMNIISFQLRFFSQERTSESQNAR